MKLISTVILLADLLLICFPATSQTSTYHRYIIEFTDKNNSPFSVNNPSEYLSQRAMDRRSRYAIPVTESDLPINPDYIKKVISEGAVLLNKSKWLNSISIETDDSLVLVAIRALPFVKSSNPIAPRYAHSSIIKNVNVISSPQKLSNSSAINYGQSSNQIDMLSGDALHSEGFKGQGIIIAVLDVGFFNAPNLQVFDSLFQQGRVLGWWNFVKHNDSVFYSGTHGTSVLSTMAANLPGQMIGTAPKSSFYLFVSEDESSEYPIEEHNWAAAAELADSVGADIISSSLGYSQFDDPAFNHSYSDMDGNTTMVSRAADFAASKGMIVCSSAGNEGRKPWYYITAPADADSIITVGAVDSSGIITAFSSHGPSADGDVKPTIVAQGIKATVVEPFSGAIVSSNGTSFSNPIIAGMTACLWQAHQDKNNMQIIEAIKKSASLYYRPNDSMGYGIPNYEIADLMLSNMAPQSLALTAPLVYPNPFTDAFGIIYYSARTQDVNIELFNMAGEKIQSFGNSLKIGYNYLPFGMIKQCPSGYYFIRMNFDDHIDVVRAIKFSN